MFTFSLQTVLEVRERMEKLKYKEFSLELMEWQKLNDAIKDRKAKLSSAAANLNQVRQYSNSAAPLQLYEHFRSRVNNEIEYLGEQLREQNQSLEAKRKELVEARRAHRALEILRDKELARFKTAETRRERAEMDEIASQHHYRNHIATPH